MPSGVYIRTKEIRKAMSLAKLGCKYPNRKSPPPFTEEHRKKISLIHLGNQYAKGMKPNKTSFKKGSIPWNKGINWIEIQGNLHPLWKGEKVNYRSLHTWVERNLGKPSFCSICNKKGNGHQIHWANKSKNYQRDLSDWVRLCALCHKAYDRNKLVLI